MLATEILKQEHRVIEVVLECLERMADQASREGRLDASSAGEAIDFFAGFADRCHHAKEEDLLFPLMESRGFSAEAGPTVVMRSEHVTGRELVQAMRRNAEAAGKGESEALAAFCDAARRYVHHLRQHIEKEDTCLFGMADGFLSSDDQQQLLSSFEKTEHDELGPGTHERYLALATTLASRFGVTPATLPTPGTGGCCGHE